jgi:hypothetical protein
LPTTVAAQPIESTLSNQSTSSPRGGHHTIRNSVGAKHHQTPFPVGRRARTIQSHPPVPNQTGGSCDKPRHFVPAARGKERAAASVRDPSGARVLPLGFARECIPVPVGDLWSQHGPSTHSSFARAARSPGNYGSGSGVGEADVTERYVGVLPKSFSVLPLPEPRGK